MAGREGEEMGARNLEKRSMTYKRRESVPDAARSSRWWWIERTRGRARKRDRR